MSSRPWMVGDGSQGFSTSKHVWKDHVKRPRSVVRHLYGCWRKGPRLDGYLAQLKIAGTSWIRFWGCLAQNFGGRRIFPVRECSIYGLWNRAVGDSLISTFAHRRFGTHIFTGPPSPKGVRHLEVFSEWREECLRRPRSVKRRHGCPPETGGKRSSAGPRAGGRTECGFVKRRRFRHIAPSQSKIYLSCALHLTAGAASGLRTGVEAEPAGRGGMARRPEERSPVICGNGDSRRHFRRHLGREEVYTAAEVRRAPPLARISRAKRSSKR